MGTQRSIPAQCAASLAEWTFSSLVNRTDAYGLWTGERWSTREEPLTVPVIAEHYRGNSIVGVHAVSRNNSCRFMVFDVDSHGDDPSAAHEMADRVRTFLKASGIPSLEEDSDGRGGRHIWVRFDEELPAAQVCGIIQRMKTATGIDCEVFPKGERTEERPFGGGFIRLPGKHPRHDHWSRFHIDGKILTVQDSFQAWRTLPCVETRVLARISEGSTQKTTEENRGLQTTTEDHTHDLCSPLSSSVYERIEDAIVKSQPLEERQRNKSLFKFSRMLAAISECEDWTLRQWRPHVKKWHRTALPVIATKPFDDTWSEFVGGFHKVKHPYDSSLLFKIFESVSSESIEVLDLDYESPITRDLLRLCVGLDRHHGGEVFFLACRMAGEVCGISYTAAAKCLQMLVKDDVLRLVLPGTPSRKAARYQLNPKFSTCDRSKQ